jgi:hypothetical protein
MVLLFYRDLFFSSPPSLSPPFYRVHSLKRIISSRVHSQCVVHIVVGTLCERTLHSRRVLWTRSSSSSLQFVPHHLTTFLGVWELDAWKPESLHKWALLSWVNISEYISEYQPLWPHNRQPGNPTKCEKLWKLKSHTPAESCILLHHVNNAIWLGVWTCHLLFDMMITKLHGTSPPFHFHLFLEFTEMVQPQRNAHNTDLLKTHWGEKEKEIHHKKREKDLGINSEFQEKKEKEKRKRK